MEHILRLDVEKREAKKEKVTDEDRFMGGRGLIARILSQEVDPLCHPLGPKNKFVVAPGLLPGTMAPSFGRVPIGKSASPTSPHRSSWKTAASFYQVDIMPGA